MHWSLISITSSEAQRLIFKLNLLLKADFLQINNGKPMSSGTIRFSCGFENTSIRYKKLVTRKMRQKLQKKSLNVRRNWFGYILEAIQMSMRSE